MTQRNREQDNSANLNHAEELQYRDQYFSARQHSYELTQQLTYFVISVELVFCGYMLLNAEKLSGINTANYLFLVCGVAAFAGALWRFFYNQIYHDNTHGIKGRFHEFTYKLQKLCYWIYVILSVVAFVWALIVGFSFLSTF